MNFQDMVGAITATFEANKDVDVTKKIRVFIEGAPGGGKSAVGKAVGSAIHYDNIVQMFLSLRDPVDLLGTPRNANGITAWCPPQELYCLREGRNLLLLEEITDCGTPMQNAACGLVYDGVVGALQLSRGTDIILTGNRTKDKSGAQRMITKLANRVMRLEFSTELQPWCEWALDSGIDPMMVAFIRARPNLLHAFDPEAAQSPTPRAWEKANAIPTTLHSAVYQEALAGVVGEGAAIEYVTFRRTVDRMPNPDMVLMDPKGAPVPEEMDILYALTVAMAHRASVDNFDRVVTYFNRLTPDFAVMGVKDALRKDVKLRTTKAFTEFAVKNANVLI